MMEFFYVLLAFVAGACAPTQAGINSQLSGIVNGNMLAALISFAVGTLSLVVCVAIARLHWPALSSLVSLPWWMWTGGCLGAFLVAATIFLVPRLGAATLMASMVAGQMLASVVFDHYGWMGYPVHPFDEWRLVGVFLLVIGVLIIRGY